MTAPSDPGFSSSEYFQWWWFNRHKIFHAWNEYGITPKPTIAVVDSGFAPQPVLGSDDRPPLLSGMSIQYIPPFTPNNPSSSGQWITGSNVTQTNADNPFPSGVASGNISHGAFIASLIASPSNNATNVSGVLPGAKI